MTGIKEAARAYFSSPSSYWRIAKIFIPGYASLMIVIWSWQSPLQLAILLSVLSAGYLCMGRKREIALFAACSILGALAENAAIASGVWNYSTGRGGVPIWLPILWGIAGVFVLRMHGEISSLLDGNWKKI